MRAKVKATGEIVDVYERYDDIAGEKRWEELSATYSAEELDFDVPQVTPEEVTIEGYVAVDEWGMGGCFLHSTEPESVAREFCDTGEYEVYWVSNGEKYELDSKLFPDMTPESEPKKVKITITTMEG